MHPTSQSIERNARTFAHYQNLLIMNPPAHDDLSYLTPKMILTFDFRVFLSHQAEWEDRIAFSLEHESAEAYDAVLIYLPKSKGELDLVLAYVAPMLAKGGDLFLVGEKKGGIASAAKKLESYGVNFSKLDSAKHCQLWQVTLDRDVEEFNLERWINQVPIIFNQREIMVASMPGVFSFSELDAGTALLMQHLPENLGGRILDFGCGCGVLGVYSKMLNPEIQLEMVDINLLALVCAEKTVALNSMQAKVYPSDGWSQVSGRVNGIVTNPPFHRGLSTEYETTEHFIHKAKDKMAKYAPFLLVANSFLKYAAIIEKTFGRCDVLAETSKFRIYKSQR
jgi:16S rRNA (guanine1207-N2)-methyltransferase